MMSEEKIRSVIADNERLARDAAYEAMMANRASRGGAFAVYNVAFCSYVSVIEALESVLQ